MWIQVRSFDGKKSLQVDNLSKLTKIEELRTRLEEHFEAPAENQRLYYRGKQLVDGHTLFDYSVGLNDLIQLMVRAAPPSTPKTENISQTENDDVGSGDDSSDKENKEPVVPETIEKDIDEDDTKDSIYKIGDVIDARDLGMGAWFESKIAKVTRNTEVSVGDKTSKDSVKGILSESSLGVVKDDNKADENANDSAVESMETAESSGSGLGEKESAILSYDKLLNIGKDDGFLYHIVYEGYDDDDHVKLSSKHVRPRARTVIKLGDVQLGDVVMANYNMEEPEERGFWYDCVITNKTDTRTKKELHATVYFGPDLMPLENCKLLFVDEIFSIEQPGTQMTAEDLANNPAASPVKRTNKPDCDHCLDNPRRKCKHCACSVCGGKHDPDKQILCDECNLAFHLSCLTPPLTSLPEEDDWYCPGCKNDDTEIVKAGEKLKQMKKKSKMASQTSTSSRDWGRGMACQGRQKVCSLVPTNHFGPVPGVEVGTLWKFRVQVSEAGIHRPHVSGIAGRESEGAFSIVLSGGYEDDTDNGETFLYTGSGGRDLSGNKRTAEQSCDQTLTRMNRALAKNVNAPLDAKNGATAKEWRAGKPVRVVRNCKLRKHSEYAPEEGNRYDGIYKVVKYWPETGKSGFLVWRFLMQRDDPIPAPWTPEGKKRTKKFGFEMQYPAGYLESQALKEKEKEDAENAKGKKGKGKRKRKDSEEEEEESASPSKKTPKKKTKGAGYSVESAQAKLIKEDSLNKKLWDEALTITPEGRSKFLQKVEEVFTCICCQDIAYKPVTTPCSHNFCKSCIQRSFKADVSTCAACRTELGKDYKMPVNEALSKVLSDFFPGYEAGR